MDTTDKQNTQSVTLSPEEKKEIDEKAKAFAGSNYTKNHHPALWDARRESYREATTTAILRERQRLRDAVNEKQTEVYEHTRYNHEAEAARIEGYELCEWFLSLLENPEPPKEP